jgi:Zn-dependent membrane protease YugP
MNNILFLIILVIPMISNAYLKSAYSKYSSIKNGTLLTGEEAARKILDKNGLKDVKIVKTYGFLSDHYNPKTKTVVLSDHIHSNNSIASVAVAAHEVGHAIQHKESYSFLKIRTALVPVVNFTSRFSTIILVIGMLFGVIGLVDIAILLLCASLLFQLVTLPVEFNASNRAKEQLQSIGLITDEDEKGVKKMLKAAAYTYVASFLASLLQVARLALITRDRD